MSALVSALAVSSETETVFTLPSINYYAIAPILILFGAAVVSVLVEAFVPRRAPPPDAAGPGVRLDHRRAWSWSSTCAAPG